MIDDYSENIDWDKVYRAFHDPKGVANNIRSVIGDAKGPLVFCGFPEVASFLSAHYKIIFVDSSHSIVTNSRARYPEIDTIVMSEIAEFIRSNPVKYVVISGRLSAFWQTPEAFQQLANGLLSHPRTQILIDYFDQEEVYQGLRTSFSAPVGEGRWDYTEIENPQTNKPLIHNVKLGISYSLGSMSFSYLARRAYFDRSDIEAWHKSIFENYKTSVAAGLLEDDPSFTIKMVAGCG